MVFVALKASGFRVFGRSGFRARDSYGGRFRPQVLSGGGYVVPMRSPYTPYSVNLRGL